MASPDSAHQTPDTPGPGPRRNASSSLRRALSILMYLADDDSHPHGTSLTDLSAGLQMSKSTVLRLLGPLREERLVDQDPENGHYRLGPQNALLGQLYLERLDIRRTASPLLHQLAQDVREAVHLVSFDPPDIVYIDKVESPQAVRMHSRIGARQPAYCTATGKAFLAHTTSEILETVITAGMPARTPSTITTPQQLHTELALIRERGYAIDDVENEHDIRCVAAPAFNHNGTVIAAISISGPASRITHDRLPDIAQRVTETAETLTHHLGGTAPAPR
ncbi:IclR family transcriptional regulator [Streptomyces sp. NPDC002577]